MEPEFELSLPGSEGRDTICTQNKSVGCFRPFSAAAVAAGFSTHPPQVRSEALRPPLTASNPHHSPRDVQKPAALRGQVIASGHFTSK